MVLWGKWDKHKLDCLSWVWILTQRFINCHNLERGLNFGFLSHFYMMISQFEPLLPFFSPASLKRTWVLMFHESAELVFPLGYLFSTHSYMGLMFLKIVWWKTSYFLCLNPELSWTKTFVKLNKYGQSELSEWPTMIRLLDITAVLNCQSFFVLHSNVCT